MSTDRLADAAPVYSAACTCPPVADCGSQAEQLNRECVCVAVDHQQLRDALASEGGIDYALLQQTHPHLFSDAVVFVGQRHLQLMSDFVGLIETLAGHPEWVAAALTRAPASARHEVANPGVFLGFDFHIAASGPKLIEINTNAGGGLLNAKLRRAQRACCPAVARALAQNVGPGLDATQIEPSENVFFRMFQREWHSQQAGLGAPRVAIVDDQPHTQYLAPEFELFSRLFAAHGWSARVVDAASLEWDGHCLACDGEPVDLVYNRLTDFSLDAPEHAALRAAWLADAVVLTPHPRAHALYADKRNLEWLSDPAFQQRLGLGAAEQRLLADCVPQTRVVRPELAEQFWQERRQWFFKPASGFGSRAAYRGDKLTKRVFAEIMAGDYIAQHVVPPSERRVAVAGATQDLKLDLRNYAYGGQVQLVTARLYQGQTTNFRTPGGGFAPVFAVSGAHQAHAASACSI